MLLSLKLLIPNSDSGVSSADLPQPAPNVPTPPSIADSLSPGTNDLINDILNMTPPVQHSSSENVVNANQGFKRKVKNIINFKLC